MDEEKNIKQMVEERLEEIPPQVKKAILESNWEEDVRRISEKYRLRIDQGNVLENQVLLLMLGLQSVDNFFEVLGETIENEDNKLENILDEVEANIVAKIRDVLQKDMSEEEASPETQTQNFVRSDIDNVADDDEMLTVTREEILKGIEADDMESEQKAEGNEQQGGTIPPDLPTASVMPQGGGDSKPESDLSAMHQKFDADKKPEAQSKDPVDIGMSNSVSTSAKDYKSSDPYREPIE